VVEARYKPGDRVRVMKAYPPGHIRTPYYIRGCVGEIERLCGAFPNPEELAQMRDGQPAQPLYRVRFRQKDVWPGYKGAGQDVVEIEIYQHWLDPA
jgi:nitrile hydratase